MTKSWQNTCTYKHNHKNSDTNEIKHTTVHITQMWKRKHNKHCKYHAKTSPSANKKTIKGITKTVSKSSIDKIMTNVISRKKSPKISQNITTQ